MKSTVPPGKNDLRKHLSDAGAVDLLAHLEAQARMARMIMFHYRAAVAGKRSPDLVRNLRALLVQQRKDVESLRSRMRYALKHPLRATQLRKLRWELGAPPPMPTRSTPFPRLRTQATPERVVE